MVCISDGFDCFPEEFYVFEWLFSESIWEIFFYENICKRNFLSQKKTSCSLYIVRKKCYFLVDALKISDFAECNKLIAEILSSCCRKKNYHTIYDGDFGCTILFYHQYQ